MEITISNVERMLWCLVIVVVISMIGFALYCLYHIVPITIVETDIPAQCIGRGC